MSISGLVMRAMAIITRWRMPPENWWGYASIALFRIRYACQGKLFQRACPRFLCAGPFVNDEGVPAAAPPMVRYTG